MFDELLGLLRERYSEKDWHVVNARLKQSDVDRFERLSPERGRN